MQRKELILSVWVCLTLAVPAAATGQDGGTPTSPSLGELALRAGGSLLLVLLLFGALVFLLRRFRSGASGMRGSGDRVLRSRARLDLGNRREIRLIEARDRLLVVGVANEGISVLAELDPADAAALDDKAEAGGPLVKVLRRMNPTG